MFITRDK